MSFAEMLTMSALAPSGNWKRMATPWALAFGSASGRLGTPVAFENRVSTGTLLAKCGALLNAAAPVAGVKEPATSTPVAWLARKPACGPPDSLLSVTTMAVGSGF